MKCSVLQQKPAKTKHGIQKAPLEAVGSKSKCRICVAIHGESVHEAERMLCPVPQQAESQHCSPWSLSHGVSADALVAGRNGVNAGRQFQCFALVWHVLMPSETSSSECLLMKGEANICNQDVGKRTLQNVLQIKLCSGFWCSLPILVWLQLFSFLFFLRWPHTFEKTHLWFRERLRNCIVICKTYTHPFSLLQILTD